MKRICLLLTVLSNCLFAVSQQLITEKESKASIQSQLCAKRVKSSTPFHAKANAENPWEYVGMARVTENFFLKKTKNVSLYRYKADNNQYAIGNIFSYATPNADKWMYFNLLQEDDTLGASWKNPIYIDRKDLVYFEDTHTGFYYNEETGRTLEYDSLYTPIYLTHPSEWTNYAFVDSLLFNRVLSHQESGFPKKIQLAPIYWVEGIGTWNRSQYDGVFEIIFPEIEDGLPASKTTLFAEANNSSGINYANYITEDQDGTKLGFYKNGSDVYFCGAVSLSETITVPDSIVVSGNMYAVNYIGRYGGEYIDLDAAYNLKDIYLPATTKYFQGDIPSNVSNLHIAAISVPSLSHSGCISNSTTVWVPQSAFASYQNAVSNSNSYWYGKDVHYEGWEPKAYTINVKSAGSLANELLKVIDQWTDVDELTIIGTLNSEDMKMFSRMTQLTKLDLSQTDIKEIGGCSGLTKLATVILPSTLTTIGEGAFLGCAKLSSINLDNVLSVEAYAFTGCNSLRTLNLPNAKELGAYAFSCGYYYSDYYRNGYGFSSINIPLAEKLGNFCFGGHTGLTTLQMPSVKMIGEYAFCNCTSLTEVDLSNVIELGDYSFYMYSSSSLPKSQLKKVTLSNEVTSLNGTFDGCVSLTDLNMPTNLQSISMSNVGLTSIKLPEGVTTISSLSSSSFTSISIPSTVTSISNSAFRYSTSLKDLYCYSVVPINTTAFNTDKNSYNALNPSGITLHVPAFSIAAYRLDDNWYKFGQTLPIDGNISNITIAQNFSIYEYTGLADDVNLTLTTEGTSSSNRTSGHLTVDAGSKLSLGTFTQDQNIIGSSTSHWDGDNYVYTTTYPYCTTLIAKNEMNADNIVMNLTVQTNRWNFISFPFDVNVSDIKMPEGTLWVVRKYSGSDRAAMNGNTWQNMTNGMILNAGEGYILHCTNESTSSSSGLMMQVTAVNNTNKNGIFAYDDVTKTLKEYPSEYAHNRSWNLIGNPYPAYLDIKSLDFTAPITVWNGNSYTAYSILDDDYYLRPNEAFFVQCPTNTNTITFTKDGRSHEYSSSANSDYYYAKAMRVASANQSNRSVLNFVVSGNGYTDKTRLVLNESAKSEYEIECDASKFMSSDAEVPQIYVLDDGLRYAIDERPTGNGKFMLGAFIGKEGEYTLKLNAKSFDGNITLTDTATGITTDILSNEYSFSSDAGTFENRFVLTINNEATGISEVSNDKVNSNKTLYNLSGQKVNDNAKGIVIENGKKVLK